MVNLIQFNEFDLIKITYSIYYANFLDTFKIRELRRQNS